MLKPIAAKLLSNSLVQDRGGNFAMMTALLLPISIGAAGVAIDLAGAMQTKTNLQNLMDAAALAAASEMSQKSLSNEAGIAVANKFILGHSQAAINDIAGSGATEAELEQLKKDMIAGSNVSTKKIVSDQGDVSYSVTINGSYSAKLSPLMSILGMKTIALNTTSTAEASTESKNALSMYLVLDRSGSMAWDTDTVNAAQPKKTVSYECGYWSGYKYTYKTCQREETNYIVKIDALKTAATSLLATISKADPNKKYARVGAVSYNYAMDSAQSLQWGTAKAQSYTDALIADGGTSSTKAFEKALTSLKDASEDAAHKTMNGKVPSKFIVFMTDGDNNYTYDDTNTLTQCAAARTEKIEVYTVAFMAPSRGQDLLKKCATSETTHYFAAESADELVAAFKAIGEKASQTATRLTN